MSDERKRNNNLNTENARLKSERDLLKYKLEEEMKTTEALSHDLASAEEALGELEAMKGRADMNLSAFPSPWVTDKQPGMALRDYFAGQVLAALVAVRYDMATTRGTISGLGAYVKPERPSPIATYAQAAYEWADAMLEARK